MVQLKTFVPLNFCLVCESFFLTLRRFRVPFSSRSVVLQEEYRKQLAGNLLKDSNIMSKNSRILAFKNKPPPPPEGFERNARMLYSENAQAAGVKRSKIFRHIPQVNTVASSDCSLYTTQCCIEWILLINSRSIQK